MKTGKNKGCILRLLVLVPHRDTRLPLRSWSADLFAAGLPGAWSFPWIAPLAALKRSLSDEELKILARELRQEMHIAGPSRAADQFRTGEPLIAALPAGFSAKGLSVYGPSLNIPRLCLPPNALECLIMPPLLGAALLGDALLGDTLLQGPMPKQLPAPSPLSFRAAALANMRIRALQPDNGYSFQWQIGKLHLLPRSINN